MLERDPVRDPERRHDELERDRAWYEPARLVCFVHSRGEDRGRHGLDHDDEEERVRYQAPRCRGHPDSREPRGDSVIPAQGERRLVDGYHVFYHRTKS